MSDFDSTAAQTPPVPSMNGQGVSRGALEDLLTGGPLSQGYRPTLPTWALWSWNTDWMPQLYLLRDLELMLIHPMINAVLDYYKSGIAGAEFWGGPDPANPDINGPGLPVSEDPNVSRFVIEQCQRFWDRGIPKVQFGYDYGWIGCEPMYEEDQGQLKFDDLIQFSPRDSFLLTQDKLPVGVRVKNIVGKGQVDLFMGSRDVPAKGLWYAHRPRYQSFYGKSQLIGCWRAWRRLAWRDGAETVCDTGVYRFAYSGPVVGFPEEDLQTSQMGVPATTFDTSGKPRRYARDMARMIAEWLKAGAGVGLPTTKYPTDQGGGDKWTFELPQSTLNVDGLINYLKYLMDQICYGVGVPPELLSSAETGSGFSGRAIPLKAFYTQQQQIADAILLLFLKQILKPLVRWNFGDVPFQVQVKNLAKLAEQGKVPQKQTPEGVGGQQNMVPSGQGGDAGAWTPFTSREGNPAWKSEVTGERRYQTEKPNDSQAPQRSAFSMASSISDDTIQRAAAILQAITKRAA